VIYFTFGAPKSWFRSKLTLGQAAMYTASLRDVDSANFALPPDYNHPAVKLVPAMRITFLRYKAFTPAQREVLSFRSKRDFANRGDRSLW
jgi:hypothetical protein